MAIFELNINEKLSNAVVGEGVKPGDLVYLGPDQRWYKSSAGNKTRSTTELMMVLEAASTAGETTNLLHYGYFDFGQSVLVPNRKYYVGYSNGEITETIYEAEGYVIRYVGTAFTDKILLFNPDQTYISDNNTRVNEVLIGGTGGGGTGVEPVYDNDIVVMIEEGDSWGQYRNMDVIPAAGKTDREVTLMALQKLLVPTFILPSIDIVNDLPIGQYIEVGTLLDINITANFNRGSIMGKSVGGGWDHNAEQDKRSGPATEYNFDGIDNSPINSNTKLIEDYEVVLGSQTIPVKVTYSEGHQPKDSNGDNYNSPYPAGDITNYITMVGALKIFFGPNDGTEQAENLGFIFNNASASNQIFILSTGNTYRYMDVYIPSSRKLTNVYSVDTNSDITPLYLLIGTVSVNDGGGNPQPYKHYRTVLDVPYENSDSHRITIENI